MHGTLHTNKYEQTITGNNSVSHNSERRNLDQKYVFYEFIYKKYKTRQNDLCS